MADDRRSHLSSSSQKKRLHTVSVVCSAMSEIDALLSSGASELNGVSIRPLYIRTVCKFAGVTEQTLNRKHHVLLKRRVDEWLLKHKGSRKSKDSNSSVPKEEKVRNLQKQLSMVAAEVLIGRKAIADLIRENEALKRRLEMVSSRQSR